MAKPSRSIAYQFPTDFMYLIYILLEIVHRHNCHTELSSYKNTGTFTNVVSRTNISITSKSENTLDNASQVVLCDCSVIHPCFTSKT